MRFGFARIFWRDRSPEIYSMNKQLDSMFAELARGNPQYLPSKYWQVLNQKNLDQLAGEGLENFKRTVALNYFTWVPGRRSDQYRWLKKQIDFMTWLKIVLVRREYDASSSLTRKQQNEMVCFTRMLWEVTGRTDTAGLLKAIQEPAEGNPFKIHWRGTLISQDLANTVLEYYSVREHFNPAPGTRATICELGAGYGREAFLFLKAMPQIKYIIVDIPPALYVSEHYLSRVFPDRKVFSFRPFDDYRSVAAEFESADIAFLLPHQAEMLPSKSVDLFLNISSLHEMTPEQIEAYFKLIDRLTGGFFYSKQWKVSQNPYDPVVVRQKDYPVLPTWRQLFVRDAKVQIAFFESMYAIPGAPAAKQTK